MTTETITEPKTSDGGLDQWPPIAHYAADKRPDQTVEEGDLALCGAKLMGINLDSAHKVCEECKRILRERYGNAWPPTYTPSAARPGKPAGARASGKPPRRCKRRRWKP